MEEENQIVQVVIVILGVVGLFGFSGIFRGCDYDQARMKHISKCLEEGHDASECEVIK